VDRSEAAETCVKWAWKIGSDPKRRVAKAISFWVGIGFTGRPAL